ncbi:omptin family outer membrane protease [Rhizobium sp.]
MKRGLIILCMAFGAAPSIGQAEDMLMTSADGAVVFKGSYGITAIEANELVYQKKYKVSQLIWQSTAVSTFTGQVKIDLDRFFVRATGTIGLGGDGYMRDFDWRYVGRSWSDRSQHPDTRLNHYFTGSIEAGREVLNLDGTSIALTGGFKYTDVQWTARGGRYVYSFSDFRDASGKFPKNEKGITYQQQWPVPFLGVDLARTEGKWTFQGSLQGGLAVDGTGTDDHWMRSLRFIDNVDMTPAVMATASVEYEFRPETAIFVSGAFDKIFRGRADTDARDTVTNARERYKNSAGADFLSGTISLGFRGKF